VGKSRESAFGRETGTVPEDEDEDRRRFGLAARPPASNTELLADSHSGSLTAEEAFPAIHRTSLRRLEGHRGFPTALRAHGHGFRFGESRTGGALALYFAILAALGLVLKVLVVEEVLFSRCKYEICSAINALENAILKLRHSNCAPL